MPQTLQRKGLLASGGDSPAQEICQEVSTHLAEFSHRAQGVRDEQAALTQTAGSSLSRAVTQEDMNSWK